MMTYMTDDKYGKNTELKDENNNIKQKNTI